jgi:Flp pilus assembly protein TadG
MKRSNAMLKRRKGSAITEFALLLPFILFIFVFVADFGRFAYVLTMVNNASREAASQGAFTDVTPGSKPLWDAAIVDAAKQDFTESLPHIDLSKLVVDAPLLITAADGSRHVSVTVTYPFEPLFPWWSAFSTGYDGTTNLSRTTTMRLVR